MTRLIGLNDADPFTSATVHQHCMADPGLRANMLEQSLIYYIMGQWHLTVKGREVMRERARARAKAARQGLIHVDTRPEVEERSPFEDLQ